MAAPTLPRLGTPARPAPPGPPPAARWRRLADGLVLAALVPAAMILGRVLSIAGGWPRAGAGLVLAGLGIAAAWSSRTDAP